MELRHSDTVLAGRLAAAEGNKETWAFRHRVLVALQAGQGSPQEDMPRTPRLLVLAARARQGECNKNHVERV